MKNFELILILFGGLVVIFGVFRIIAHLLKLDKYLEEEESTSAKLTSPETREHEIIDD